MLLAREEHPVAGSGMFVLNEPVGIKDEMSRLSELFTHVQDFGPATNRNAPGSFDRVKDAVKRVEPCSTPIRSGQIFVADLARIRARTGFLPAHDQAIERMNISLRRGDNCIRVGGLPGCNHAVLLQSD